MMRTTTLRSVARTAQRQQQRRLISSSPISKDAASSAKKSAEEAASSAKQAAQGATSSAQNAASSAKASAEGASKALANFAEKAKQAAGPVGQKLQGALGGYADPLIYNAKVAGHIAKQVYIAESLAPPKSFSVVQDAYKHMYQRAQDTSYWQRLIQTGEWKKFAIYAVEAYGIFTIGEMLGRRSLVGYKLDTHGEGHHH